MKAMPILAGAVLVLGVAAFTTPRATAARTAVVEVHCPEGNHDAFVTPAQLHIAVGDSVEWDMAGNVDSDSLIITPKDTRRAWPFEGRPPRGSRGGRARSWARAHRASQRGTYSYSVTLACRAPGGGTRAVTIDPDIIIE
jgi:plastocyanin